MINCGQLTIDYNHNNQNTSPSKNHTNHSSVCDEHDAFAVNGTAIRMIACLTMTIPV